MMFSDIWTARPFNNQYRCYSISMFPGKERAHVDKGGKIIMPPSALDQLSQLNISYPMLFKLTNESADRVTHCGVLEFVAEEGKLYMPHWMMQNLFLQEGELVRVQTATLPRATFSRFQPLALGFLEVTNPKAVLENALRNYACLTAGDVIAIHYNEHVYEISVLETKPAVAVSIIECDMNVEFAPPLGYDEDLRPLKESKGPLTKASQEAVAAAALRKVSLVPEAAKTSDFKSFTGQGQRLVNRKTVDVEMDEESSAEPDTQAGVPDFEWKFGTLKFMPGVILEYPDQVKDTDAENAFKAFSGSGQTLKPSEQD